MISPRLWFLVLAAAVCLGCGGVTVYEQYEGSLEGTLARVDLPGGCLYLEADDGYEYHLSFANDADQTTDRERGVIVDRATDAPFAEPGDRVKVTGEILHYAEDGERTASLTAASYAGCRSWLIVADSIEVLGAEGVISPTRSSR